MIFLTRSSAVAERPRYKVR